VHACTESEKKIVRFYCHLTRSWAEKGSEFQNLFTRTDIYEIVESYFKILRKYGISTFEEPYYFLSPKQKREVKVEAEMLKRNTQLNDFEIKVSLLEGLL